MSLKPGQIKCINTLDEPLVVAAGAGSGKTFTLTRRIVHALESGYVSDIDQVLAITFTRKAAGELKSRVKAALRAGGRVDQALKVDDAWISTIHGMCARILREHAIELGLDPAFALGDGPTLERLLARAVDSVLVDAEAAGFGTEQPAEAVSAADVRALFAEYPARSAGGFGVSVESMLRELVERAAASPAGTDAFVLPPAPQSPVQTLQKALSVYEGVRDTVPGGKASAAQEAWMAAADEAIAAASAKLSEGDADARSVIDLIGAFSLSKRFGTKDFKERVAEAQVELDACMLDAHAALAQKHLRTLIALAREVAHRYGTAKQQYGFMDNNDLLTRAADALESYPAIAAEYTDKFKLIMIDEFQDTDQMQVDMIKRLAGPSLERLCTVGDAQQSIYRFRGADVQVYRRHLADVRARNADDIILLPDNFRSHGDVLSFVDRVFEQPSMFGGEFMSLSHSRDERAVAHPFRGTDTRIAVQLTSTAERGGASSADVCAHAADRIAQRFAALKRAGHPAGDMVVLLGRMANAGVYAQALRAHGLSCVIAGGTVFAASSEVGVVQALLSYAANPHDTQALFAVVSSPLFALDAGDLIDVGTRTASDGLPCRRSLDKGMAALEHAIEHTAHAEGQGTDDGAADADDAALVAALSPELENAVRVLARLRYGVGREPLSYLVKRVVVDAGWIARLEEHGGEGQAVAANVYKAIRIVDELERDARTPLGPATLAKRFAEALAASKEAPGALSAAGSDFVRIMTVHASKGLEFPIVAVADMPAPRTAMPKFLAKPIDGQIYVALEPNATLNRAPKGAKLNRARMEAVAQQLFGEDLDEDDYVSCARERKSAKAQYLALAFSELAGDEEEAKRLLYVALTRAKESLVVSLRGKMSKSNPGAVPKDVMGAVVSALTDNPEGFSPGSASCGFGGERPALVRHEHLDRSGEIDAGADAPTAESEGAACDAGEDGAERAGAAPCEEAVVGADAADAGAASSDQGGDFMLPAPDGARRLQRRCYAPTRGSVFSYSSIAEASRGSALVGALDESFSVSSDGVADDDPTAFDAADAGAADFLASDPSGVERGTARTRHGRNIAASIDEDDLASRVYFSGGVDDDDKATDLGTAFHRLAQLATVTRNPEGPLEKPDAERVASMVRACGLDADQRIRLTTALDRWFRSDLAREVVAFAEGAVTSMEPAGEATRRGRIAPGTLAAEVPFFLELTSSAAGDAAAAAAKESVQPKCEPLCLEGSIDLLATAPDGERALVVDYKTGGRRDERDADLRRKHVLQASCYALALLRQGYEQVEAVFVRVEQGRIDDARQPQRVCYRFAADDLSVLEKLVGEAYAQSARA